MDSFWTMTSEFFITFARKTQRIAAFHRFSFFSFLFSWHFSTNIIGYIPFLYFFTLSYSKRNLWICHIQSEISLELWNMIVKYILYEERSQASCICALDCHHTINNKTVTNENLVLISTIFVDNIKLLNFTFLEKNCEELYQIRIFKKINEKNISMRISSQKRTSYTWNKFFKWNFLYLLRIEWAEMICSVTYKKLSQIIDLIRRPRKILDNDILRAESFWKLWVS